MMKPVYCISSGIASASGLNTETVWNAISAKRSGVQYLDDTSVYPRGIWASRLSPDQWAEISSAGLQDYLSPLEAMAAYSVRQALDACNMKGDDPGTLFVFSTTKGNIEWLGLQPDMRNRLSASAALIARAAGITSKPVVVSHACVSGVTGLIYALHALQAGRYDTVIITGADRLSRFVVSGFASFQALADERCKPFDAARKGINLGEAAATIVLSAKPGNRPLARLLGGSTSNDANHISGPSRTGEELALAINRAIAASGLTAADIDVISAHGTATIYNDEMESKAFAHAGLLHAPVHSMKGYFGHTLGAAGVLESAMLIESIRLGQSIASAGFENHGVSMPVRVSTAAGQADIRYALKTASGFGGCNAAVVWGRV